MGITSIAVMLHAMTLMAHVLHHRPAKLFTQPSAPPPSSAELALPQATDSDDAGILRMVQLVNQLSRSVLVAAANPTICHACAMHACYIEQVHMEQVVNGDK